MRALKGVLDNRLTSLRPAGKPRLRLEDNVFMDSGLVDMPDWRTAAQDRLGSSGPYSYYVLQSFTSLLAQLALRLVLEILISLKIKT